MKSMFLALAASLAFLAPATASPAAAERSDEGAARGTVVLWENFHSGKPTGHLQARLFECGRVFAQVYARLEDNGCVTGYVLTECGTESIEGEWCYDRGDGSGEFEIELEIELNPGDDCEIELEGCFEGTRAFWQGEWELED